MEKRIGKNNETLLKLYGQGIMKENGQNFRNKALLKIFQLKPANNDKHRYPKSSIGKRQLHSTIIPKFNQKLDNALKNSGQKKKARSLEKQEEAKNSNRIADIVQQPSLNKMDPNNFFDMVFNKKGKTKNFSNPSHKNTQENHDQIKLIKEMELHSHRNKNIRSINKTENYQKINQRDNKIEELKINSYRANTLVKEYQQQERRYYRKIYYDFSVNRKNSNGESINNNKYDDKDGDYIVRIRDHIAYRFQIIEQLGKGAFGVVIKAFDHKFKRLVAIKMIRNNPKYHKQAQIEIKILKEIKQNDFQNTSNVVKLLENFQFRHHQVIIFEQCLVFQLLSINLYQFTKINKFKGFSLDLIRRFSIQILNCLYFIDKRGIIHCDLKPQNILIKQQNKSGIKIIDFGSSCYQYEPRNYTYIQSRYYRAPETMLGLLYKTQIDMWSFGCILAQLYTAYPLFPGQNQQQQMQMFMQILDVPPLQFLIYSPRRNKFFTQNLKPKMIPNSKGKIRNPGSKKLNYYLNCKDMEFVDFVGKCLIWKPENRMTPLQGLKHKWILDGLPEEVRIQYIHQLNSYQ